MQSTWWFSITPLVWFRRPIFVCLTTFAKEFESMKNFSFVNLNLVAETSQRPQTSKICTIWSYDKFNNPGRLGTSSPIGFSEYHTAGLSASAMRNDLKKDKNKDSVCLPDMVFQGSAWQIEPCVSEEVWSGYLDLSRRICTGTKDMFGYQHHLVCKNYNLQQEKWGATAIILRQVW